MKQYLIVDLNSDWKELMDYKEIKKLLISTIQEDLLVNNGEYDIVKDCSNDLIKMAKEDYTSENWIKEKLESYSYKIIDLLDLQRDLEDVKGYFLDKQDYVGAICETIDKINKEVNKNV